MPHYEQRKWEEEQMSSAVFRFGAKQKDLQQQEYDLVLDNQIDFIQALCMPGNQDKDKVKLLCALDNLSLSLCYEDKLPHCWRCFTVFPSFFSVTTHCCRLLLKSVTIDIVYNELILMSNDTLFNSQEHFWVFSKLVSVVPLTCCAIILNI